MGKKNILLLANNDSYAFKFASEMQKYISIEKEKEIPLHGVHLKKFRNGEILPHIPENIRGRNVYLVQDSNKNPQEWWVELLLMRELLLNSSAESVTFVLPEMNYSRQDRKDKPHVPISARALANSISPGLKRIITMDLHAPQIQGFYPQNVPVDNLYSFPAAAQYITQHHKDSLENLVIVSPDVGGTHRASAFGNRLGKLNGGKEYDFAIIDKKRTSPGEVEEMTLVGDVKEKDVIVVDDLIDSGNTLVKAGKLLREEGTKKLICYGAHGLFTNGTESLKETYDSIITSNSRQQEHKNIEIVDVVPLFAEAIYRAHSGQSISKLFE